MTKLVFKTTVRKFLADWLLQLRSSRHYTQEEMAQLLFLSSNGYGDLERGQYNLSSATVLLMLIAMDEDERTNFLLQLESLMEECQIPQRDMTICR